MSTSWAAEAAELLRRLARSAPPLPSWTTSAATPAPAKPRRTYTTPPPTPAPAQHARGPLVYVPSGMRSSALNIADGSAVCRASSTPRLRLGDMISAASGDDLMNYADKAAALDARADDLEGRLPSFAAEAAKHALAATEGDKNAIRKLCEIDAATDAMKREANTARVAAEQLRQRERQEQAKAAAQDRAQREAAARQLCDLLMKDNTAAAAALAAICERRKRHISELSKTGVLTAHTINHLQSRFILTGAIRRAGLHAHFEVEDVAPPFIRPLSELNSTLRSQITQPERAA